MSLPIDTLLRPPRSREPDPSAKKKPSGPNDEQSATIERVYNYARFGEGSPLVVAGCAGTGKTYTMARVIDRMLNEPEGPQIRLGMLSPTNQAVKQQWRALGGWSESRQSRYPHMSLVFLTVHKALRVRPVIRTSDGVEIFVTDTREGEVAPLESLDVVIVDEASMLDDSLFEKLMAAVAAHGLRIVFVGDELQVPPVNHSHSKPFDETAREEYGLELLELTQVVRQASDSPIIGLTMGIRQTIRENVWLPPEPQWDDRGDGVHFPRGEDIGRLVTAYYTSEEFEKDMSFCRLLAYHRRRVAELNFLVRQTKWGVDAPTYVVGDALIAIGPVKNDPDRDSFNRPLNKPELVFTNNDEMLVREVVPCERVFPVDGHLVRFSCLRLLVADVDTDDEHWILALEETQIPRFEYCQAHLKKLALAEPEDSPQRRKAWGRLKTLREEVAPVAYAYAITAHRSQGCTVRYAFMDEHDIMKNPRVFERNRIKYTAATRSKERLFIMR